MKSRTITVGDLTEEETKALLSYQPLTETTGPKYSSARNKLLVTKKSKLCYSCDQFIPKGMQVLQWKWQREVSKRGESATTALHLTAQWCPACMACMAKRDGSFAARLLEYSRGEHCQLTSKQYYLDRQARWVY